ncbi:MAG TPA: hypothetical protein VEA44_15510 [Caulobacter sp.]|nr:hypothetical protein [Caulobacter sp.]
MRRTFIASSFLLFLGAGVMLWAPAAVQSAGIEDGVRLSARLTA